MVNNADTDDDDSDGATTPTNVADAFPLDATETSMDSDGTGEQR